jgi:DNA-directed RNA polymerase subunit F
MTQTNHLHHNDQRKGDKSQASRQNAQPDLKASESASRAAREAMDHSAHTLREAAGQATRVARETTEQTTRLAHETMEHATRIGRESAERASRLGREAAEVGGRAARAGAEVFAHNTDALQHAWESGISLATQLSEQSFDQIVRMFGVAGERTRDASQSSSRHVEAILHSSAVLTGGLDTLSREWIEFAQQRVAQQRDRFEKILQIRTPQDFTAIQAEVMRDAIEGWLQSCRRVAEASLRLTEEAANRMAPGTEHATKKDAHRGA